ncbi:MAG: PAS domain S-box-containing protein [Alphaproteobacteria bacterium]|jgi:PAS domain S-box-containing protein
MVEGSTKEVGNQGDESTHAIDPLYALRKSFEGRLSDRVDAIDSAYLSLLDDDNAWSPALKTLEGLLHKFAGAAGTYGFPEISHIAKSMEKICGDSLAGRVNQDDARVQLGAGLEGLSSACAQSNGFHDFGVPGAALAPGTQDHKFTTVENRHIVIVDDDVEIGAILKLQLERFGFRVTVLTRPGALGDILEDDAPAAVLMDIVFPDGEDTGVAAVQALRDQGALRCPVVFMSVRDDLESRLGSVRAGCDGYLVKPLDFIEAIDLLNRLVESSGEARRRILIVDDDVDVGNYYTYLLRQAQFDTRFVESPLTVMEAILSFDPDVILMDVNMPDCDGFELAKVIRQNHKFVRIPIVFLTAGSDLNKQIAALRSGADDFIDKSTTPEHLLMTLNAQASRSRELSRVITRLEDSEKRFRAVADTAADAVISVDSEGRITFWNECAGSIFGYTGAEILGRDVSILVPQRHQDAFQTACDEIKTNGASSLTGVVIRSEGRRKDGSETPLEISVASWRNSGRQYFTSIIRDTTDRIAAEAALREANIGLEARVERRTVELRETADNLRREIADRQEAESLLLQSQKLEIVGQLTGGMSHDFNNLLGIILGNMDVLSEYLQDDKEMSKLVDVAQRAAVRGAELTQRLLAFSRRQVLQPKPSNVNDVIDGMSDLLKSSAGERIKLKLSLSLSSSPWTVNIDRAQLEASILNLSVNADQAMANGGVLEIRTENVELSEPLKVFDAEVPCGKYVGIFVKDDGCGMAQDVLDQAFNPFFTTKGVGEGSGLGLSMVHGFVRQSDGFVSIQSAVGQGAEISLYLPIIEAPPRLETAERVAPASLDAKGVKILVVEENEDLKTVNVKMLETLGYRVVAAIDAKSALDIILSDPEISLVFSDIVLPGNMSGVALGAVIQSHRPEIKIIYTSSYLNLKYDEDTVPSENFIGKPFRLSELSIKIKKSLNT